MDDSRPGVLTRGGGRLDAFAFPDALCVSRSSRTFEAFGLRARGRAVAGGLELEIDGEHGRVDLGGGQADGDCALWPFAAVRGRAPCRETLFAAADQPLVALIREHGADFAWRLDGDLAATVVQLGGEWSALVVYGPAFAEPDVESLLATAVARARRRAANRPMLLAGAADPEELTRAEYELRRQLRRAGSRGIVLSGDDRSQALGVLALHALNDGATADEVARALDVRADGALAALVTGASAAWRGIAPASSAIPSAAAAWMRGASDLVRSGELDAWSAAALALAPTAAEVLGAADIVALLRTLKLPRVRPALAGLADATPAGRVLGILHETLGIEPDAVRGRVGIRPARTAERVDVERIQVGEGVLSFRAEVGAERATYEVEQTSGGTPLSVLLEPGVPGRRLTSARVDDTDAELDAVQEESELRVKVQLVADRPRRLELRYER